MAQQFKDQYARLGINDEVPTDPIQKAEVIYQAACRKLSLNPEDMPDVSRVRGKYRASQLSFHKLEIIRDAIVGDREAKWNDYAEYKWGSWFYLNSPGFRFVDSYYSCTNAVSGAGSRLCTFSKNDQDFFAIECIALWAEFHGGVLPE
ncbi:MAG TPA: hypothetical protein VKQ52_17170 [Puia sp.]|nr:hypothetical protein [Puia sp.]